MNKMVTVNWLLSTLKHKMPLALRLKIVLFCLFQRNDSARRNLLAQELFKRRLVTTPRKSINWFPTIDSDNCTNCGVCFTFCPKKVFSKLQDKKIAVVAPYECVLLCSGCIPKCPQRAISFPKIRDFRKYVEYR